MATKEAEEKAPLAPKGLPCGVTHMQHAIALSENGMTKGYGGPFGAIIVDENDNVIAEGWNTVTSTNDPTAHAEVVAIRRACKARNSFKLEGCTVYSSCEPCPMCLSAIYWAGCKKVYYGADRKDAAGINFADDHIYRELKKPNCERAMPTEQVMQADAQRVLAMWKAKTDKIRY